MALQSCPFSVWFDDHFLSAPFAWSAAMPRPYNLFFLACGLAGLTANKFAGILYAFAFVDFRGPAIANVGSKIANSLFIGTTDYNDIAFTNRYFRAFGWLYLDRMRIAKLHDQLSAVHLSTIANTNYFQLSLKAYCNALNHIGYQGAAQSM
jgi:hypothetical protein